MYACTDTHARTHTHITSQVAATVYDRTNRRHGCRGQDLGLEEPFKRIGTLRAWFLRLFAGYACLFFRPLPAHPGVCRAPVLRTCVVQLILIQYM